MGRSFFDKVWDAHVIADLGDDQYLLHVDRHLLHDLSGGRGLLELRQRDLKVANPELCFATPDHAVSTEPDRAGLTDYAGKRFVDSLRGSCAACGIRLFDLEQDGQGIVHVIGPELGITLPGALLVCGDSHTCTHGGLGALSWGIGSSEVAHVLATQTIQQRRPKRMRITLQGRLDDHVSAKDLVLYLIGEIGAAAGVGYAIEYAGPAIREMPVEGRLTICNLSIEFGAKIGMVAPDDAIFEYLAGRRFAPTGETWDRAVAEWRTLPSDDDAVFDREVTIDAGAVRPQITWGNSPQDVLPVDGRIPDPATASPDKRPAIEAALGYMDLTPGAPIEGVKVDRVFIGSCTNSRLSDLRDAARIAEGRKVAEHVEAWVVPGSEAVKRAAEAEGLDKVFRDSGFQWRAPGCSMCVAANGDRVAPGARCVSTSNRNFVGRQGPGSRTHLASPAMAAAAAVSGHIADVRKLGG